MRMSEKFLEVKHDFQAAGVMYEALQSVLVQCQRDNLLALQVRHVERARRLACLAF